MITTVTMTLEDAKATIVAQLQQQSINTLVNELARVLVENEALKNPPDKSGAKVE